MKVSWKSASSLTLCTSLLKENEKWFENSQYQSIQSILGSDCAPNLTSDLRILLKTAWSSAWSLFKDLSQKDEDRVL